MTGNAFDLIAHVLKPGAKIRNLRTLIRKHELAYGYWLREDGSRVAFNRKYFPIWHHRPGGAWEPYPNRGDWIEGPGQTHYFYDDKHAEQVKAVRACVGMMDLGIDIGELGDLFALDISRMKRRMEREARCSKNSNESCGVSGGEASI